MYVFRAIYGYNYNLFTSARKSASTKSSQVQQAVHQAQQAERKEGTPPIDNSVEPGQCLNKTVTNFQPLHCTQSPAVPQPKISQVEGVEKDNSRQPGLCMSLDSYVTHAFSNVNRQPIERNVDPYALTQEMRDKFSAALWEFQDRTTSSFTDIAPLLLKTAAESIKEAEANFKGEHSLPLRTLAKGGQQPSPSVQQMFSNLRELYQQATEKQAPITPDQAALMIESCGFDPLTLAPQKLAKETSFLNSMFYLMNAQSAKGYAIPLLVLYRSFISLDSDSNSHEAILTTHTKLFLHNKSWDTDPFMQFWMGAGNSKHSAKQSAALLFLLMLPKVIAASRELSPSEIQRLHHAHIHLLFSTISQLSKISDIKNPAEEKQKAIEAYATRFKTLSQEQRNQDIAYISAQAFDANDTDLVLNRLRELQDKP